VALNDAKLTANGFTLAFESTGPLLTRMETMPDVTLEKGASTPGQHQAIVVRSREPVTRFMLTTRVQIVPTLADVPAKHDDR
jgi:hypothetical protein